MGFFYETGYVRFEDRNADKTPESSKEPSRKSYREQGEQHVIKYALETYDDLAVWARLYSITSSEFCSADVDTVLYSWDYMQFVALEKYVDFCEDRRKWSDKGGERDRKIQEVSGKNK